MRGLSLLVLAIGCAAPAQGPAPAPPRAASLDAPPAPSATVRVTPGVNSGNVTFRALPALVPASRAPHIEIERPAFGDRIDPELADRTEIALRVLDAPAADVTILLSLDGKRPRRWVSDRKLTLRALYPEDQALAPGAHLLFATAIDGSGHALGLDGASPPRPLALVGFSIGASPAAGLASTLPSLFCLNPSGTLYLAPNAPALFQVLALGGDGRSGPVPVRVRGRGVDFTSELDLRKAYEVVGLPLGDVTLSIGRAPGPYAECVVTINPETAAGAAP